MHRFPLRYQLMLPLVAVAVASLLAIGGIGSWLATYHTHHRIEAQLRGVVQVLTESNFPLTAPVLRQMRDLSSAEFVLTDAAGRTIVSSLPHNDRLDLPHAPIATSIDAVDLDHTADVDGRRYFHSSLAHRSRPDRGQAGVLHILFPQNAYQQAWRAAFLPPLAIGVLTVVAIAAVTQAVASRIGHVVRNLGDDVRRLAEGDFRPVDLPGRNDELRDLATAVNQTADKLADYQQQVRRTEQLRTVALLGAGLAHEIRNAATGCRMAVDLHAEGCEQGGPGDSLVVAKQQLDLMETRLQRFLELGKPPTEIVRQRVELIQLVDELLLLVRPSARHAGVALAWSPHDEPVYIDADPESFGQAVVNLVLNAIEAVQRREASASSPRQVSVRVHLPERGQAELEVSDTGSGPGEAFEAKLFEPFISSKSEGVGLGLVVAKQVVDAHGGTIAWNRERGCTCFRIRVPVTVEELSHV